MKRVGLGICLALALVATANLFAGRAQESGSQRQPPPSNGASPVNPLRLALLRWYGANTTTRFAVGNQPYGGDTLVAGNPTGSIANNLEGEAYIILKPTGGWVTTNMFGARLTPSDDQRFDEFGDAVAISGQTILVGDDRFQVMEPGAAFVFGH